MPFETKKTDAKMKLPSKRKPSQSRKSPKISPRQKGRDDFVFVARRLGADEDKGRFEKMLGKIARAKSAGVTALDKDRFIRTAKGKKP